MNRGLKRFAAIITAAVMLSTGTGITAAEIPETQTEQSVQVSVHSDSESEINAETETQVGESVSETESEETKQSDVQGTDAAETIETSEINGTEISGAAESETIEPESIAEQEKTYVENSFRYDNGRPIDNNPVGFFSNFTPWTKVDGHYINSVGEVIEGAIARGIDVSEHQGKIDWEKVREDDVSFAIVRCGFAGNHEKYDDKFWKYNADECTRLGIPFGTYLYSYAQNVSDAEGEAEHVLRLIEGYSLDYPIYYDLEDITIQSMSKSEIAEIAEAFCSKIEAAGYDVEIYSNTYWWTNILTDPYFDKFKDKWVAQYNTECTYKGEYAIWQCSSQGSVKGIGTNVDLNMLFTDKYVSDDSQENNVGQFVKRLYELILNREAEEKGLKEWTAQLINKKNNGADVVYGFVYSDEFQERNLSDDDYIEVLYQTCLGRAADEAGKEAWKKILDVPFSRLYVLRGFIESDEFTEICNSYGIIRGSIDVKEARDKNDGATRFVSRCYNVFLGRPADVKGLNEWTGVILKDKEEARNVPYGFVFSEEMKEKNLSDEDFIRTLYKGILDRDADDKGVKEWVQVLKKGKSREHVFYGFVDSPEFTELLNDYGL